MSYILDSMEELKLRLLSDDFGKHLMGVEDLLQKHSLVEADINVLGERVKQVHCNISTYWESGLKRYTAIYNVLGERVKQVYCYISTYWDNGLNMYIVHCYISTFWENGLNRYTAI